MIAGPFSPWTGGDCCAVCECGIAVDTAACATCDLRLCPSCRDSGEHAKYDRDSRIAAALDLLSSIRRDFLLDPVPGLAEALALVEAALRGEVAR